MSGRIWYNGPAQVEHETLEEIREKTSIDDVRAFAQRRQFVLESENVPDYTPLVAFALGFSLMFGQHLYWSTSFSVLGLYISSLSICHMMEYVYAWRFHPNEASISSFLLFEQYYPMVIGGSFLEYFVGLYFFPSLKSFTLFNVIGALVMIAGQTIRTVAMWTAGSNFHHYVRVKRESEHKLVTDGIYKFLRHPSYFGWFWWAFGSQVMMANFLTSGVVAYGLYLFFSDRIVHEEETLVKFFGSAYDEYRKKTPIYIPFIK